MANSIDDFLSKSSPEQKEKFDAMVKDAVLPKVQQTEAERNAALAQKTALRNDPTKGQEQTPQETQKAQNAVDRALSQQDKAEVKQVGQDLQKAGVSIPKENRDR